jgi:PAS domain S-box-containing protein
MLGYDSPEDLISSITDIGQQLYVNPQDRDLLKRLLAENGAVNNFETLYYKKDGSVIWVEFSARVAYDKDRKISYYEGITENITDRKRMEEQLHQMNEELERRVSERTAELKNAHQEIENISFSLSHDLRTPLRAMDGFSRIIQSEYGHILPDGANRYIEILRANAQQMGVLLDGMRDFLSINRKKMEKSLLSLVDIIDTCLTALEKDREGRNIEIVVGNLPVCEADPFMIKVVFYNLLSNAIKFTNRLASAKIEIGCCKENEEVICYIKDNGIGFDMKYADKVFGAFQKLHSQDEFKGAGLGLNIAQSIIRRHGGRIWAKSAPDRGTTFFFTFETLHLTV